MKIAFITGASSGIGQAMAHAYIQSGWHVVMVARRTSELKAWCEQQPYKPNTYTIYAADVRDIDAITSIGKRCMAEIGLPDLIIAAAGVSIGIDTTEFSDIEVMRKVYETNNIGMMATFQPFINPIKQRGSGQLVGIASVAGIRGLAGHGAYCSSKAAVISYCESLRLEMKEVNKAHAAQGMTGQGIHVITLLPGYVATPLTQHNRYGMPFLLSADEFARRALRVITNNQTYAVIPWQMGIVAKFMRAMPNWLFDRLFTGRARKHRENEKKAD